MPSSAIQANKRRSRRGPSRNRTRSSLQKETSICLSLNSNSKSTEWKTPCERCHRRQWSRTSSPRRDRANSLTTGWPSPQHKKRHISEKQQRRRQKISTEEEKLARQRSIISKLGLIPGERALKFAEAYDSISWLPKACKTIGLSPPVSPPKAEKFNLMPRPAKFSKAMKSMTALNKYGEDILNGMRKNCGHGCNLDANYEKLLELSRPTTSSTYRRPKSCSTIPTFNEKISPKPKKRGQISEKRIRNATLLSSGIRLDRSYNKTCCEPQSSAYACPCAQSKSTSTCKYCVILTHVAKDKQVDASQNRFSTPVADRILKLARFHITGRTQHKSTNTEPALNCLSYGPASMKKYNLPIFFKYYNVSPNLIDVSPGLEIHQGLQLLTTRFIKGCNC